MYNPNNEMFNRQSMSHPLSQYELKFKESEERMKLLLKETGKR